MLLLKLWIHFLNKSWTAYTMEDEESIYMCSDQLLDNISERHYNSMTVQNMHTQTSELNQWTYIYHDYFQLCNTYTISNQFPQGSVHRGHTCIYTNMYHKTNLQEVMCVQPSLLATLMVKCNAECCSLLRSHKWDSVTREAVMKSNLWWT